MKRNVLVIDGNAEHVERVTKLMLEVSENIEIYTTDNLADAYLMLMEITIDIFVLDAVLDTSQSGDTSGIRLVERIRKIPKYMLAPVIFTTVEKDPSLYAYTELNCLSYMTKPCPEKRFKNAFEKALNFKTRREAERVVIFRKAGALYPIRVKEIVYIECMDHILHLQLSDGTVLYVPYKSSSRFLEEADVDYLVRCSRGVIVNKNFVLGIDVTKRFIHLRNGMGTLDIGSTYRKKMKEEFLNQTNDFNNKEG